MSNPNNITAQFYDIVSSTFKGDEITLQEIELITSLTPSSTHILDIGGGTGRHAIKLAELGYDVSVVDSSIGMIKHLNMKLGAESFRLKAFHKDIFKFESSEKFNLIIMFWNTFNEIALSEDQAKSLLFKCRSLLSDGGKILINIDNADNVDPSNFDFTNVLEIGDTKYEQSWRTVDYDKVTNTSTSSEKLIVSDSSGKMLSKFETEITQRYWRKKELENLADKLGLKYDYLSISGNDELYIVFALESNY